MPHDDAPERHQARPASRHALAVLMTLGLLGVLWAPPGAAPPLFAHSDKLAHLLGFAAVSGAWTWSTSLRPALVLAAALAAVSELVQAALPWPRTPDVADFAFDLLGAFAGAWCVAIRMRS